MIRRALHLLVTLAALAASNAYALTCTGHFYIGYPAALSACQASYGSCVEGGYGGLPTYDASCQSIIAQMGTASFASHYSADVLHIYVGASSCPSGMTQSGNECVETPPTSCPDYQHDSGGTCVPDNPEPANGQQMPEQLVYLGEECSVNPEPCFAALNTGIPVNCGGYSCSVGLSNYSGECVKGGTNQTSTFCSFNPIYQGGGVYVPPTTPAAPTPTNTAATLICPAGYSLGADGLCRTGQTTGFESTLAGPSQQGTAGTATCPAGYTLGADGSCRGATSTGACPTGYTYSNGVCTGTVSIGSGGSTGSGTTGTGLCGGAGQPACTVKVDGSDINPNAASSIAADYTAIDAQHQTSSDSIANWIDPSSGSQSSFRDSFADWVTPIPITGCSPWSADIAGNTWTVDFCSKAAIIASWLEYVMWFLLMISTFKLLTTRYP